MKITVLSDTHGQHSQVMTGEGDLIIHAGDITRKGTESQVRDFLLWYARLPFTYKIFIAGNHDFLFEKAGRDVIQALIPENIIYLNDSGVTLDGIRFWGSPVQPWFYDWAFNRQRGAEIDKHWQMIPEDTDVLITHGPAYGILDETVKGQHVGCLDLLHRVQAIQPAYHICGHIHEDYGCVEQGETVFINACVLDVTYRVTNDPVSFEM